MAERRSARIGGPPNGTRSDGNPLIDEAASEGGDRRPAFAGHGCIAMPTSGRCADRRSRKAGLGLVVRVGEHHASHGWGSSNRLEVPTR